MVVIIFNTAIIVAYMIDGRVGLALMSLYVGWLFLYKKGELKEKVLHAIIFSLPMAFIGLQGMEGSHILSWYNIFLTVFMIIILKEYGKHIFLNSKTHLVLLLPLLLIVNLIWSKDLGQDIIEIVQVLLMLVPIVVVHGYKNNELIKQSSVQKSIILYGNICVSTALGMIIQYVAYNSFGRSIGIMQFSGFVMRRTAFFALFRGASILPIFMTSGFLVFFLDILEDKSKLSNWLKCGVILIAVALESSRTGLLSLIITVIIVYFNNLKDNKITLKSIFLIIVFVFGVYYSINHILTSRAALDSFLDGNGRSNLIPTSIKIWTANFKNFVLGEGFTGGMWAGRMKPHNFLFQSLAQCGIVFTSIIFYLIFIYLHDVKRKKYRYLVWLVLISGLFVTDFYANAFTTVIFLLIDMFNNDDSNASKKGNEISNKTAESKYYEETTDC